MMKAWMTFHSDWHRGHWFYKYGTFTAYQQIEHYEALGSKEDARTKFRFEGVKQNPPTSEHEQLAATMGRARELQSQR